MVFDLSVYEGTISFTVPSDCERETENLLSEIEDNLDERGIDIVLNPAYIRNGTTYYNEIVLGFSDKDIYRDTLRRLYETIK